MSNKYHQYKTRSVSKEELGLNYEGTFFFFESMKEKIVLKLVGYTYIEDKEIDGENRHIFNFGFGDIVKGKIEDLELSSNGDARAVFETVLNTVPSFFIERPDSVIFVSGSDSKPEFALNCRKSCVRCVNGDCRKQHRRINLYTNYVNENFKLLTQEYIFYGGVDDIYNGEEYNFEPYNVKKKYKYVLCRKK